MSAFLMVTTTVAALDRARELGRTLVEARLAACVQVLPIESVYRWEGAVEMACEHLLVCKIAEADYAAVEAAIAKSHEYDVPEIVAIPIAASARSYIEWLAAATTRPR